ncbi:MAG TPA: MBL fold metallo-hydrolase, partial [Candidatus Binatia bacterium]|nr:MBL fold metallo-hydrolase [Candidatus Binatia bacterium]
NLIALAAILSVSASSAQDLGPGFHKIKDGIYTFAPDQTTTTCSFVVTQEGVVVIDSCNNPLQSRNLLAAIRKVTDMPVLFLINTETHGDHSGNNFVFSPPAMIINAEGAGAAMKKAYNPKRAAQQAAQSAEMAEAVKGEKLMVPHIEYNEKMTLNVGERSFDLIYLKNVHSEADTAVWMPKERVLFAASAAVVRGLQNLRPAVVISDVLASYKLMKALNPEIVVTGHGPPTTTKVFDEYEGFFTLLVKRVGEMAAKGSSLEQIKKELKLPEYADWAGQDRLGLYIDAAYRSVKK